MTTTPFLATALFASLMASAPVGMVVATPEGRLLEVNPAFCAMLERDRQELLATDWQDLTHPADLAGDQELVQQMLSGELETFRRRKRYLKPDGRLLWGDAGAVLDGPSGRLRPSGDGGATGLFVAGLHAGFTKKQWINQSFAIHGLRGFISSMTC